MVIFMYLFIHFDHLLRADSVASFLSCSADLSRADAESVAGVLRDVPDFGVVSASFLWFSWIGTICTNAGL